MQNCTNFLRAVCVVVIQRMSSDIHVCDYQECGTANVTGPKVNCVHCNKVCFLQCYGFSRCGLNGLKLFLPNGLSIALDPKTLCVTCSKCDAVFLSDALKTSLERKGETNLKTVSTSSAKQALTPNKPNDSNVSLSQLKGDFDKMSKKLNSIMTTLNVTSADVCDVKATTTDTNEMIKSSQLSENLTTKLNEISTSKLNEVSENLATKLNEISSQTSALSSQTETFASIMRRQQTEKRQPIQVKRRLEGPAPLVSTKPKNLPEPKIGKRTGAIGLIAAAPKAKFKPKFDKSLHVSRIDPSCTVEQLTEYITSNGTGLIANEDFKCVSLIKKGKELDTYSFISYKIDICEAKCEQLMEEEFWPDGVAIRIFVPPERTLGDFLPSTSSATEQQKPSKMKKPDEKNEVIPMDTVNAVTTETTSNV